MIVRVVSCPTERSDSVQDQPACDCRRKQPDRCYHYSKHGRGRSLDFLPSLSCGGLCPLAAIGNHFIGGKTMYQLQPNAENQDVISESD